MYCSSGSRFWKMCSSSMATCCWMVSTAGGSSPSTPTLLRSARVKAASLFCEESRRICSPRDQRTLKAGFGFMAQYAKGVSEFRYRPGRWPRSEEWPPTRSEEHTSELQSRQYLVCRLLLEKKK